MIFLQHDWQEESLGICDFSGNQTQDSAFPLRPNHYTVDPEED